MSTKSQIVLIHWNQSEARERADRLERLGFAAQPHLPEGAAGMRKLQEKPPDAFVIDLGRLPLQGRDLAIWLRRQKATRLIPIVFVVGDPRKVTRIRTVLPDAVFSDWRKIRADLRRAMKSPLAKPVVPGIMDSYAGTPLVKKLGIKADMTVALLGAPAGFPKSLGTLPEGVRFKEQARGAADLIVLFAKSQADLRHRFPAATRMLAEKGGLWLAWPKKASGVKTDLTQAAVRALGLASGLVDYKISAIDSTWSGLLFTRRRK